MSNLDQSGNLARGRVSAGGGGEGGATPLSSRTRRPATRGGSVELPPQSRCVRLLSCRNCWRPRFGPGVS
eukprot:520115-Pyramimonas_sp.AAC.1